MARILLRIDVVAKEDLVYVVFLHATLSGIFQRVWTGLANFPLAVRSPAGLAYVRYSSVPVDGYFPTVFDR
jgi:hypothetical protein